MRILLFVILCAFACKGGSSSSGQSATAQALLPAAPDLAVRLDVERVRTWPGFAKVAPVLLRDLQPVLDEIKAACGLDPVAEAKSVLLAKQAAEIAVVIAGLPKERVTACAGPDRALRLDGDLLSIHRQARAVASGKFLGTGELVLLSRGGGALDAAAWKAEETKAKPAPAWTASLDPSSAAAVWVVTPQRKVLARTDFASPLVVKASVASETPDTAKRDQQLVHATGEYFKSANAGTLTSAIAGSSVEATLTVAPEQIDALLALVTPMLTGIPASTSKPPTGSTGELATDLMLDPKISVDCESLPAAVEKYLDDSVKASPAKGREKMQAVALQLRPELQKLFRSRCVTDQWSTDSIRCFLATAYASKLRRFERCQLTVEQRKHLDADLGAAMAKVGVAPITKESVQKDLGSGSALGGPAQMGSGR